MPAGATSEFQAGLARTLISTKSKCCLMVPWQSNSSLSGVVDPPAGHSGENCTSNPMVNFVESLLSTFLLVFVVPPTRHVKKKRQQCILHAGGVKICDCSYFYSLKWLLAAVGLVSSWKAMHQLPPSTDHQNSCLDGLLVWSTKAVLICLPLALETVTP